MADLFSAVYNPDVLSCLANLSNDEVFTPPELANQVLDMLPEELWSDPNAKFLDPCSKTGVFLREIAKRLIRGQMPDFDQCMAVIDHKRANGEELSAVDWAYLERLQPILDYIFHNQLFGIGITQLTALMTRRSLYCSKWANGKYSVVEFDSSEGNIRYRNLQHTWAGAKGKERCKWCGAPREAIETGRSSDETHAYELIHTPKPEVIFNMQFDVIVGNPPYQLETGGAGKQAKPIYNLFVEQALKLNPRYLTMIIPSRWFAGGMGLDDFRAQIQKDKRFRRIVDYANAKECFPENSISGGVCYFLWDRDHSGECEFINRMNGEEIRMVRSLDEWPVLIRYNEAVSIIRKVQSFGEPTIDGISSSLMPFGLSTNIRGTESPTHEDDLILHSSDGTSFLPRSNVTKGEDFRDSYKVLISKTGAEHAGEPSKDGMFRVLTKTMKVLAPNEICTHSYFVVGQFKTKEEADHLYDYLRTKFVRFLILQTMTSINVSKLVLKMVPQQDWSISWDDDMLFEKYALDEKEVAFIQGLIKEM